MGAWGCVDSSPPHLPQMRAGDGVGMGAPGATEAPAAAQVRSQGAPGGSSGTKLCPPPGPGSLLCLGGDRAA